MRERLHDGLNPPKRSTPYPWRDKLRSFNLYVFELRASKHPDLAEGVEAELVFLIRHLTGKWPTYQHEIHFRHKNGAVRPEYLRCAESIYRSLGVCDPSTSE
jgi:hypothetical protein